MAAVQHLNHLLASLSAADFELLRSHLKPFEMVQGDLLFDAGDSVNLIAAWSRWSSGWVTGR